MKSLSYLSAAIVLCLGLATAQAQPGMGGMRRGGMGAAMGGPAGPNFDAAMSKLFGDNTSFSATMEMQTKTTSGNPVSMPGKLSFDTGKSRFEMDMSKITGTSIPPNAVAQMKAMGMDQMVAISRPDKKVSFVVYPGLNAYAETPMEQASAAPTPDKFKIETTELGKETFDGHPCVKNKAVVTDDKGATHESTIWNATDLKNFPVKIEQSEGGANTVMLFKDVKLGKVEASQFEPPSGSTKYASLQDMMMTEMMKRRSGR